MREILFRGKRIDNGEWTFGNLEVLNCKLFHIVPFEVNIHTSGIPENVYYNVIPSSVGQYTGLTDKNGKKIFEGDIVEYPIEQGKYSEQNIHEVVFETRQGAAYFGIKMSDIETWDFCLSVPAKLMRVIGNIHDTPELLEVKK